MVPRAEFLAQMRYLQAHYDCLPLADALLEMERSSPRGRPIACVTFDDGYLNNRTVAYPILASLGIPATIYLTTGFVGTSRSLWTTTLELALSQSHGLPLELSDLGMMPRVLTRDSFKPLTAEIIARLKRLAPVPRETALASLLGQLPTPHVPDAFRFMSWPDVSAVMSSGLIAIGAHTVNHELLSRLETSDVVFEVGSSIATIAAETGQRVLTFAYPNGTTADFDDRSKQIVRDAGCIGAVSTRYGLNGAREDRFALRRVVIGAFDTIASFRIRCAGMPGAR
jgi:peptidoglycan/xylan/chitin deacetylase (PgdA/CDA1 family)